MPKTLESKEAESETSRRPFVSEFGLGYLKAKKIEWGLDFGANDGTLVEADGFAFVGIIGFAEGASDG